MHTRLNWAMGHALQQWAKRHGVEPLRLLAEKTADSPSVAAPHCIAHYPIAMLPEAAEHLRDVWTASPDNGEGLQAQMNFLHEAER